MEKAPRANYNNSAGAHLNVLKTAPRSRGERINETNRQERVNQKGRIDSLQNGKMEPRSFLIKLKKKRDKRI